MFFVENNNITMTKGDSGYFVIRLENKDGTEFEKDESDELVFTVKKRTGDNFPVVIRKTGTQIIFEAKDTENVPSGEYIYDVYIKNGEERQTVIEGRYILKKAVHAFE